MKLIDVNLLLYAYDRTAEPHVTARRWLEEQLSSVETVAFPWVVLLGFIRLSTKRTAFVNPLSPDHALDTVDRWLTQPCTTIIHPTERHPAILRDLISETGTAGNLTTDAHLAALAIEHGAQLCSADADFSRFPGLRWVNPLR